MYQSRRNQNFSSHLRDSEKVPAPIRLIQRKCDTRANLLVRAAIYPGVAEADIKTESSFVEDLGADSLDNVELVMALEEEFECEIPDEEAEKITTVGQAISYIKEHLPNA